MRHINAFRVSTDELVWLGEYDPETTIFTEALEASGVPDLAETATQSHHVDGEGWVEVPASGGQLLRCRDFEVLLWTDSENQRGSAPSEVEEVVAKDKPNKTKPKTPSQPPAMKVETLVRQLKVQLTAPEIAERADRAAKLLEDRDRAEAELKAHATHAKSLIAQMEAEMRALSGEVRTKFTYRDVECERRFLYATGCVQEVRLDTEEVIAERAMTEKEKQRDLPFTRPEEPVGVGGLFGAEETAAE